MKEMLLKRKGIGQILSIIFCLAMCILLMPNTVYAAEENTEITEIQITSALLNLYAGETFTADELKSLVKVTTTPEDAVTVSSAWWVDAETNKVSTKIEEGHSYRLAVMLVINDGFIAKEDSENPNKFGGDLTFNKKDAYDAGLNNTIRLLIVYGQEITAQPAPFVKQPEGGVAKQDELFEIRFDTGSFDKDIYLWKWSVTNTWYIYARYGRNGTYGTITAPKPGETDRYKMSVSTNRHIYGDEFEVTGGSDYFTTVPVGGTSEGGKPYTITFDHACTHFGVVYIYLEKYNQDTGVWEKKKEFTNKQTSYDIPYGTPGATEKYRLVIKNGASTGVDVYGDEFEVTWGKDIFAKQPVGGKCPLGEDFTIDFAVKDYADTATFELQYRARSNFWQTVGTLEAPYTIAAKSTEVSNYYRIKCTYNDNVFYSNTFKVEWANNYFITQPVGGNGLIGEKFRFTFKYASNQSTLFIVEGYEKESDSWVQVYSAYSSNAKDGIAIAITNDSCQTVKYRIHTTVNETDVYSDEFEINWLDTPFKTQPVGGICLIDNSYQITFETYDLNLYNVTMSDVVLQCESYAGWGNLYNITSPYELTSSTERTDKYRLKCTVGGKSYYSDEFTLEWVKELPKIQKDDLIIAPERIVVGSVLEDDDAVVETDDDFLYGYIEGYLTWVYTAPTGEVTEYCYYPASDYYKFVVTQEMSHGSVHIELYNENKSAIWVSREVTFDDIHNFEDGACTICGEKYKTGLTYYNNNWYYFVDNEVDTTKTDIVFYKDVWYYVQDGVLNKAYAGLVNHGGKLWYVSNGKLDKTFSGFVAYDGKTYLVKNGTVDTTATGFKLAGEKWAKVINGVVDDTYTGLYYYNNDWWYLTNGFLDKTFKGVTPMNGKLWFIRNGKISRENGITKYDGNIYWITNGAVDTSATKLFYYADDATWYYFRMGVVDWTYNTLAYANNAWWYINNGVLDKTYTGLVLFREQLWYVTEGLLDKAYVGTCEYQGKTYSVANGIGTLIE